MHIKDKSVSIVYVIDKNYVDYMIVSIQSIFSSSKDNEVYNIIILDNEEKNSERINYITNKITKKDNFHYNYFSIKEFMEMHKTEFQKCIYEDSHFTNAIYGRLFIPELLKNIDKVIYSDADIIYERDVSELMRIDLKDNIMAGVIDVPVEIDLKTNKFKRSRYNKIQLDESQHYINSGVLLIDNKAFLKNEIKLKSIKLISENKFQYPDQDALNIACRGKIYYLGQEWNCLVNIDKWINKLKDEEKEKAKDIIKEYKAAFISKNGVYHYGGAEKPWVSLSHDKSEKFWKCAEKTNVYMNLLINLVINVDDIEKNKINKSREKIKYIYLFGIKIIKNIVNSEVEKTRIFGLPILRIEKVPNKKKIFFLNVRVLTIRYKNM